MEVKYTKGSKTLEELQAQYDAEMKRCEEERKQEKYAYMEENGYFHSAKEMIDFVLNGGKIEDDLFGEWMQLKDGKIIHYKLFYNIVDMPIGMDYATMSIEGFKTWAHKCEEYQKENGSPFVNQCWHPYVEDEL